MNKLKLLIILLFACAPVQGPQGVPGKNGHSIVYTTIPASVNQCSSSGTILLLATDVNDNNLWEPSDSNQSSIIICNGNSTTIDPIKLCTSVTIYPNSFPEYALCIDNALFGVYWDKHTAWLSEIPPGNYKSTSSTDSCSFTVDNNCHVTW